MIRDPNKRYAYQPTFFNDPDMLGYYLMPIITCGDEGGGFPYQGHLTLNGYMVAYTAVTDREEAEVRSFNGMQEMAASKY